MHPIATQPSSHATSPTARRVVALLLVLLTALGSVAVTASESQAAPPSHAGGGKGGDGGDGGDTEKCHPKKGCPTDTAPSAPVANDDDATVDAGAAVVVTVLANDADVDGDIAPSTVRVHVAPTAGTASVDGQGRVTFDAAGVDGPQDVTFGYEVCDTTGLCDQAAVSVAVAAVEPAPEPSPEPSPDPSPEPTPDPSPEPSPEPSGDLQIVGTELVDPTASRELTLLGNTMATTSGGATVVLTTPKYLVQPRLSVVAPDGSSWHVDLPVDSTYGFEDAVYTIDAANRLHVLGGVTEMYHRRYQLTGSPVTAAELLDTHVYGDRDSRVGAIVALDSGGVVATWHQQGVSGPQGHHLLHVAADGTRDLQFVQWIPTKASKSALVQHPTDGSVWLFANPDAWGRIGAARLLEGGDGLTVDWTDAYFIGPGDGLAAPDPENPRVYALPDPSTGTVAVAYQSADRILVGGTRASRIAVTRVDAAGGLATDLTPSRTERITWFGFSVRDGAALVTHPVVAADGTHTQLRAARLAGGVWTEQDLGRLATEYAPVLGTGSVAGAVATLDTLVPTAYRAG